MSQRRLGWPYYLERRELRVEPMGRGHVWLDIGAPKSPQEVAKMVDTLERRQGSRIARTEQVVFPQGLIIRNERSALAGALCQNARSRCLFDLAQPDNR